MNTHIILSIFHILVVVPFLGYIFFNRASNPEWIYTSLFFVGIFLFIYQTYKSIIKYISKSSTLWVNLFHVLIVAPLLIYIGYKAKKTERGAYELLGILTFGALGYHLYNFILMIQVHNEDD